MGRQVRFFMLNQDEASFIENVYKSGDIIVDKELNTVSAEDIKISNKSIFYILSPNSTITKSKNGYLDPLLSDTIEFSRNIVRNEAIVSYGRLWVELKYYNENGESVTKSNWLKDKFVMYRKWIVKNSRLSECKDFYIGENTYKLYKENGFGMMATPNQKVEFL